MTNKEFKDTQFDDIPDIKKHYYICVNVKKIERFYSLYEFDEALPHTAKCLIPFMEPVATVEVLPDKYHKISKMIVTFGQDQTFHLTEKDITCIYYEH